MANEDSSKQAAISSDTGVVHDQDAVKSTDLYDLNEVKVEPGKALQLGADANEGASSRFNEPTAPSFELQINQEFPNDYDRLTGLRRPHPSFYRGPRGEMLSTPGARKLAQEHYKLAQENPSLEEEYMSIAAAYAVGERDILTKEELQEANDGGALEFIGTAFEGFDAPRRALWQGVAWSGQALPDPGTMIGDAVQDVVGVVGGLALGATIGAVEGAYSPISAIGSLFEDEETEENPIYPVLPGQEMVDGFNQMSENLYEALATGELHEGALKRVRPWLWHGSTEARVLSGDMLIDAMLTREQAYEMSLDETKPAHLRAFARHVSTDTGRLAYGILAEFIMDPLWFAGKAKGASASHQVTKLYKGIKTTFDIQKPLIAASGAMQMISKSKAKALTAREFDDVMATIVVGTADEADEATLLVTKYAEIATASAQANKDGVQKLAILLSGTDDLSSTVVSTANMRHAETMHRADAFLNLAEPRKDVYEKLVAFADKKRKQTLLIKDDPIKAKRFLDREVKRLAFTAKTYTKHQENLNLGLRSAVAARENGEIAGVLKKTGFMSWHIPFTSKYGYTFASGPLDNINKVIQGSPTASKFIDDYSLKGLETRINAARVGIKSGEIAPTPEVIFANDRAAYLAYGMQKAAGKAMLVPAYIWTTLAKVIGTRHIQPLVQVLSHEAYDKAGHLFGTRLPGGKFLAKMKRVDPKIWADYQDAIGDLSLAFSGMEMELRAGWVRLVDAGNKLITQRKKDKKKKLTELRRRLDASTDLADKTEIRLEIKKVSRWGTKDYTLDHALSDVADADERQLGQFGLLSDEMKAVHAETKNLITTITSNNEFKNGRMRVEQALVNIIRKARGDRERQIKLMSQLNQINIGLERVSNFREIQKVKAQKALLTRVTQLRSLREGIENVDSDILVKTLEELRSIRETGVYDEAVHAEHIFNFIKDLTKSDIAARQILRRFALGMGEVDGGTALAKLLVRLEGSFDYVKDSKKLGFVKAMERAVNGYLSDLNKEYKALSKAYRKGEIVHDGSRLDVGGSQLNLTTGNADLPGMTRKEFRKLVNAMIDENDSSWKLMVPTSEHQAFKEWIDGASELVEPAKPIKPKRTRRSRAKKESEAEVARATTMPESHPGVVRETILKFTSENKADLSKVVPDEVNREVFSHLSLASAKALIAHLSSNPEINSKYLDLIVHFGNKLGDDVLVSMSTSVWDNTLPKGALGASNTANDTIKARTIFLSPEFSKIADPMEVLAHEVIHAATVTRYAAASKKFEDGVVSVATQAADDIRKIFNFVVEHANKEGFPDSVRKNTFKIALSNPQEMMAYAMSNEQFYHWLNKIDYKPKAKLSVLHVLIEKIKRLFGKVNEDGVSAELSKQIDNLLLGADPMYFPGTKRTYTIDRQQDLFPALKGEPGSKEYAQSKAARTKAIKRSERLAKRKTAGKKEKVFNFEPSEKTRWNQARTYYERVAHLRKVSKNTRRFTTKQSVELAKARLGIVKPLHSWTKHERFRLQDELKASGVRLWSRFLIDEDHAWYFAKPRPKLKKPPVEVKSTIAPPKEQEVVEAPEVKEAPVTETVEAKPTAVPTTDAAPTSHEASNKPLVLKAQTSDKPKPSPKKETTPKPGKGRHRRGEGQRSGAYRNVSDDREFKVKRVQDVKGKHFVIFEKIKGKEDALVFKARKFSSQSTAFDFLKKLDDEAIPEGRLPVKVQAKTRSTVFSWHSEKRKSYQIWVDPNTNKEYVFFNSAQGKRSFYEVKDGEGTLITRLDPVIEGGKVIKPVLKGDAWSALEEMLNTLDGVLPETDQVSKIVGKIAAEAKEEGDLFVKPVVVAQLNEEIAGTITLPQMKEAGYVKYHKGYKPQKDDVLVIFDNTGALDEDHYRIVDVVQKPDGYEVATANHAGDLDDLGYIDEMFDIDNLMVLKAGAKQKPKSKGLQLKSGAPSAELKAVVAETKATAPTKGLTLKTGVSKPDIAPKPPKGGQSAVRPQGLQLKSGMPELPASLQAGPEKYFKTVKAKDKVDMYPKTAPSQKALKRLGWKPYNAVNIFKGHSVAIFQKKQTGNKLDFFGGGTVIDIETVKGVDILGKEIEKEIFVVKTPTGEVTKIPKEQMDDVHFELEAGNDPRFRVYKVDPPKVKPDEQPLVLKSLEHAEELGFGSPATATGSFRKLPPGTDIAVFENGVFKAGGTVVSADRAAYSLSRPTSTVSIAEITRLSKGGEKGDPGVVVVVKRPEVKTVAPEPTKLVAASKPKPLTEQMAAVDGGDTTMDALFPRTQDPGVRPLNQQKALKDYNDAVAAYKDDRDLLSKKKLTFSFDNEYRNLIVEDLNIPLKEVGVSPAEVVDDILDTLVNLNNSILDNRAITGDDLVGLGDVLDDVTSMIGSRDTYYGYFLGQRSWKATELHAKLTQHAKKLNQLGKKFLPLSNTRSRLFHKNLHNLADGILTSDFNKIDKARRSLEVGRIQDWASQFPTPGTYLMEGQGKTIFHPNMLREKRIKDALETAGPEETAEAILHIINKGEPLDPMVNAILKKALKKHSKPLKSIFNKPDTQLATNLEKELSTLKSDITKFLKSPEGDLPNHRNISKFIDPVSRKGMALKGAKDRRTFTDTALGQVQKATIDERKPKLVRATDLVKRYEDRRKDLEKYMEDVQPHFGKRPEELPGDSIDPNYRPLETWEMQLWDGYAKIAEKHGLTDLDQLQAVFTVLKETPKIVNKDMYPELAKMYPSLLGNRYGDELDPNLVPAMVEMRTIIDRYQELYKERGYEWVASPERIMREWGVLNYVPHMYKEMDTALVRDITLGKVFSGGGNGIDQVLWTGKPANESRDLAGSILELKALMSPDHDKVITMDPLELWGRYTQMNRAMTNEDFILTMLNTGVARFFAPVEELDELGKVRRIVSVEEQIAKADYVPMFSRPNKQRSKDLLHRGDLRSWMENGLGKRDIEEFIKGMDNGGVFANWLNTSPKIMMMRKTQQAILRVRGAQASAGLELINPTAKYRSIMDPLKASENEAWDLTRGVELRSGESAYGARDIELIKKQEVNDILNKKSDKVWQDIADEINREIVKYDVISPKLTAGHLRNYYSHQGQISEAYIPRAVKQGMEDTLEMGNQVAKGPLGAIKKPLDLINAWWKTRVTVTSVAFSTRNHISNKVSNILDLGVWGALNPFTNMLASQLSVALLIKEEYGSITKFLDEAAVKKGPLSDVGEFLKGGKDLPFSLRRLHDNGVDFGNGIIMELDEVLDDMVGSGVMSPAFTQFSDIGRAEMSALEQFAEGGAVRRAITKKYGANIPGLAGGVDLEDAVIVGFSMGISGGLPVALPKNFGGKHLARIVENQARASNFLANFKKSGVWSDAAAHSNKFLFDYGDLTQFQRQIMRTIFPFFTWSIKNIHLQLDMMQKSPKFFAQFHRIMSDGVPQIFESTQEEGGYIKSDPIDIELLRTKEHHYRHTIGMPLPSLEGTGWGNLPVPVVKRRLKSGDNAGLFDFEVGTGTLGKDYFPRLKGAKLQGLGLPQEALVSNLSTAASLLDPRNHIGVLLPDALGGKTARARTYSDRNRMSRILGEIHFLLRAASELTTQKHSFYDKPIAELTDGRLVNEILRPLDAIPIVGGRMKAYMHHVTGLRTYTYYDKFNQRYRTKVNVHGMANYMLGLFPWMRNFRDAAAATEMFYANNMLPIDELVAGGAKIKDLHTVPPSWSLGDAFSGVNVRQVDEDLQREFSEKKLEEMRKRALHANGILKTFDQDYVPYK